MPAIITEDFRITNMTNFIAGFENDPTETHFKTLFVGLAKNDSWPTDGAGRVESDNGFIVPTPTETVSALDTLWGEIIALKRLFQTDLIPVVREATWESGDKWNFNGVNPNSVKKSFISTDSWKSVVRNSEGRVYQCKAEPSTGTCYISGAADGNYTTRATCEGQLNSVWVPTPSNVEPTGVPANQGDNMVFGNYTWEYLWTIGVNERAQYINDDWQPLSYSIYSSGTVEHTEQTTYGTLPERTPKKVGSVNLMVRIFLSTTDSGIPEDDDFRRLFLIDTPRDSNGDKAVNSIYNLSGLSTTRSGNIIFIENKQPVLRSSDQQEDIRLILQY